MGTWGAGNFDNDGARDYLGDLVDQLNSTVEKTLADRNIARLDEDGETVLVPSVAILSLLAEHLRAAPPKPDRVAGWKEKYLAIFDEDIDEMEPAAGYKEERRAVIVATFEKLEKQSKEFWQR